MDVDELLNHKRRTEAKIRDAVSDAMQEFAAVTGFSLRNIDIHLHEVTRIGDQRRKWICSDVTSEIDL